MCDSGPCSLAWQVPTMTPGQAAARGPSPRGLLGALGRDWTPSGHPQPSPPTEPTGRPPSTTSSTSSPRAATRTLRPSPPAVRGWTNLNSWVVSIFCIFFFTKHFDGNPTCIHDDSRVQEEKMSLWSATRTLRPRPPAGRRWTKWNSWVVNINDNNNTQRCPER